MTLNQKLIEDLTDQLDALLGAKPESGDQWAEICRLEDEIEKLQPGYVDPNSQFGVGS
jgi:hypothetical protein